MAKKYNLKIIQDTSHGIESRYRNKHLIYYGDLCIYSMHPLKNLNVWGDGGFVVTQNKKLAKKLYLLRNHGLVDRNTCKIFGYNSRLDTIQAVIANYKMKNKYDSILTTVDSIFWFVTWGAMIYFCFVMGMMMLASR